MHVSVMRQSEKGKQHERSAAALFWKEKRPISTCRSLFVAAALAAFVFFTPLRCRRELSPCTRVSSRFLSLSCHPASSTFAPTPSLLVASSPPRRNRFIRRSLVSPLVPEMEFQQRRNVCVVQDSGRDMVPQFHLEWNVPCVTNAVVDQRLINAAVR